MVSVRRALSEFNHMTFSIDALICQYFDIPKNAQIAPAPFRTTTFGITAFGEPTDVLQDGKGLPVNLISVALSDITRHLLLTEMDIDQSLIVPMANNPAAKMSEFVSGLDEIATTGEAHRAALAEQVLDSLVPSLSSQHGRIRWKSAEALQILSRLKRGFYEKICARDDILIRLRMNTAIFRDNEASLEFITSLARSWKGAMIQTQRYSRTPILLPGQRLTVRKEGAQ